MRKSRQAQRRRKSIDYLPIQLHSYIQKIIYKFTQRFKQMDIDSSEIKNIRDQAQQTADSARELSQIAEEQRDRIDSVMEDLNSGASDLEDGVSYLDDIVKAIDKIEEARNEADDLGIKGW